MSLGPLLGEDVASVLTLVVDGMLLFTRDWEGILVEGEGTLAEGEATRAEGEGILAEWWYGILTREEGL